MKTTEQLLYYVGVQFGENTRSYSYLCYDLTVHTGDRVVVPVTGGRELTGTVVSAVFCTADDTPYPLEKTKAVIRRIEAAGSEEKTEKAALPPTTAQEQPLPVRQAAPAPVRQAAPAVVRQDVPAPVSLPTQKTSKRRNNEDLSTTIVTTIIMAPFLTALFALPVATVLAAFDLLIDGYEWVPLLIAFPFAVGAWLRALNGQSQPGNSGSSHGGSGSGSSGSGWYPGSPEDKAFSFMDGAFDLDGDGHLNSAESFAKHDVFFGDDE